ncbi:MAG: GTPase Era [Kosmotoga sp.]|nr:MAG: GTPase Era [Kosmotoga sp.]
MNEKNYISGTVTVVGKPNVGKSTLVNNLIGEKVAIVSDKIQTTRNRIAGILTNKRGQIIFYDTPGIHKPLHKLGNYMVKIAVGALQGSDLIAVMLDLVDGIRKSDFLVSRYVNASKLPVILLINKIDTMRNPDKLRQFVSKAEELFDNILETIEISAKNGTGIDKFLEVLYGKLPEGKPLFPEDIITDRSYRFMASEIIREKVLYLTEKEVPHCVGIEIRDFIEKENGVILIRADIVVERKSQKPIIIGKQGKMIKKIGTLARRDMEYLFDQKVYLELFVKVRKKWREKDNFIMNFTNLKEDFQ